MSVWPVGLALDVFDAIDSTNAEARRRVEAGENSQTWLAAHRQTHGRGRQARPWSSEPGNLAATLLTPFQGTPAEAARLSYAVSLAVADTVAESAPNALVALKWPNDVLANRRKISGILLENFGSGPKGTLMLGIGIGLNLNHTPDVSDAAYPPISIHELTGQPADFDRTLVALAVHMERWLAAAQDFNTIRAAWMARAIGVGQAATARLPRETITGRFMDLDADGALVLEADNGPRRIAAGDVFFPGAL